MDRAEQNADAIKEANALDMEFGAQHGLSSAMLDRLKLDDKRILAWRAVCAKLRCCPSGRKILDQRVRPNGLKLQKISTPIGVVVIIYESRPNVTADAASLCLKLATRRFCAAERSVALKSDHPRTMIDAGDCHEAFPNTPSKSCPRPTARRFRFAVAHAICGFMHAARWREFDSRRGAIARKFP